MISPSWSLLIAIRRAAQRNRLSAPVLSIATKNVVLVAIEAALLAERLLEASAGAVDANLGGGNRAIGDLGDLRGGVPLEVVKHESRPVVLRQTLDDLADAAAHLVDDQSLIELSIVDLIGPRLVDINHPRPAVRPAKVVGGHPGGDGECPGLDAGPSLEFRQGMRDLEQRFLEKIVGGGTVARPGARGTAEAGSKAPADILENRWNGSESTLPPRWLLPWF